MCKDDTSNHTNAVTVWLLVTWPFHWLLLHFIFSTHSAAFLHLSTYFLSFSTCTVLPPPFQHFSCASTILPLWNMFPLVQCASDTVSYLYWASSADILLFIHLYICLYISSGSHVCTLSLNINYTPPPFMSVCFRTLSFSSKCSLSGRWWLETHKRCLIIYVSIWIYITSVLITHLRSHDFCDNNTLPQTTSDKPSLCWNYHLVIRLSWELNQNH